MTTTPVVPAPESAIERFIDEVKAVFLKAEPVGEALEAAAVDAEPILALTPAGPEYQVAVNAIVGAQQVAQASIAAGTNLTGTQKAAIAVAAATPALNTILTSKGVSSNLEAVISTWIQNVFNILAGPVASFVTAKTSGAVASPTAAKTIAA